MGNQEAYIVAGVAWDFFKLVLPVFLLALGAIGLEKGLDWAMVRFKLHKKKEVEHEHP